MTEEKKKNPHAKRTVLQVRVDNDELQIAFTKAQLYAGGDMSKFLRLAIKGFRPYKKK